MVAPETEGGGLFTSTGCKNKKGGRWEKPTGSDFVALDKQWVQKNLKNVAIGVKLRAASGETFPHFCL
jgi:hypothetical protein